MKKNCLRYITLVLFVVFLCSGEAHAQCTYDSITCWECGNNMCWGSPYNEYTFWGDLDSSLCQSTFIRCYVDFMDTCSLQNIAVTATCEGEEFHYSSVLCCSDY